MKRRTMDLAAALIGLSVFCIAWLYPEQFRGQSYVMAGAGLATFLFFIFAMKGKASQKETVGGGTTERLPDTGIITEIVLLSEEDTELLVWDLYGKTAAVIGRDVRENQVDIDLEKSPYASMVDIEHAVLNFSCGSWYVEDLGSSNGIGVKKAGDGKKYKLSADTPCRVERGDCIYVGHNRLLLR